MLTLLKKHEYLNANPPLLENIPQGPAATRENTWDFPFSETWGTIPLHCVLSNSMFPIQHGSRLDLLDGTPKNPQEKPHKSRMTLMSTKECEIVRCNPNQFEMTPDSPVWDQVQSPIPLPTRQVACLNFGNYRDSLIYPSHIKMNTNSSTGTRVKLHGRHIISRRERVPRILLKKKANFPQAPQEYPSLSSRYVRGSLSLLPQLEWILRCPDSKECRISLQWLECRLVFHRTRKSYVWIPCGESSERPRCPPHLDSVLTSVDTSRGKRSSVLQKLMMPDSSWKLIGIPISLCELEKETWTPT